MDSDVFVVVVVAIVLLQKLSTIILSYPLLPKRDTYGVNVIVVVFVSATPTDLFIDLNERIQ